MADTETVRYITRHYRQLQGLRDVPIGLWMLAFAAVQSRLDPSAPVVDPERPLVVASVVGSLALVLAASWEVGRWYDVRFGHVEAVPTQPADEWGAVLFGLSLGVASFADAQGPWSVSLTPLVVGGMLVWRGRRHARFRAHYTVVGIVVLACAWPPLTGINVPPLTLLSFLCGVALIVIGIADHCVLRRCLQLAGTVDRPHA